MTLNSVSELEKLIKDNICVEDLSEECYSKTIYVEQATMDNLIKYELDFQPYMDIAKKCLLQSIQIMKSTHTNRFYIGLVNLGGHGPAYEIRPVRLAEIKDHKYIEKMFANHGQELDWGIDINIKYKI